MSDQSPTEFLIASSVRTEIVTRLADGALGTPALLEAVEASDSAVYDALSTLAERGTLAETDDAWALTAHGQLAADAIDRWQATESFLAAAPEFWKRHDASTIPPKYRRRLPEIGDYEVVRSDGSQVDRHHRAALRRMESADDCLVMTPFFSVRYDRAVPDAAETRMLVHPSAVDTKAERIREGLDEVHEYERATLRLTQCEFSFTVGDDFLVFNLPTESGDPTKATVVSETDSAVRWATELFEAEWAASDPIERYAVREHPDVWG